MVMIVWFSSTDNSIIFVTEFFSCNSIFQYLWLYAKIVWSKCNNLQIQVITNGGTCNKQIHTMFNQEKGEEKKEKKTKTIWKRTLDIEVCYEHNDNNSYHFTNWKDSRLGETEHTHTQTPTKSQRSSWNVYNLIIQHWRENFSFLIKLEPFSL